MASCCKAMMIYAAIDLRAGKCVRLHQGDFDAETVYTDDPVSQAAKFASGGADWIHVVDLDAARTGEPSNLEAISAVARAMPGPVQVGGGVRSVDAALRLFDSGVTRVVIGTAAVTDPGLVHRLARTHRVAVGLDGWAGDLAISGWEQRTGKKLLDTVKDFADSGVEAFVVTEIARDGTMLGPDVDGLARVLACTEVDVIASGGVGALEHLQALASIEQEGRRLAGVIIGRALYEGAFDVAQAIGVVRDLESCALDTSSDSDSP